MSRRYAGVLVSITMLTAVLIIPVAVFAAVVSMLVAMIVRPAIVAAVMATIAHFVPLLVRGFAVAFALLIVIGKSRSAYKARESSGDSKACSCVHSGAL